MDGQGLVSHFFFREILLCKHFNGNSENKRSKKFNKIKINLKTKKKNQRCTSGYLQIHSRTFVS